MRNTTGIDGVVICPNCNTHYNIMKHNWCPNCRMTFKAAKILNDDSDSFANDINNMLSMNDNGLNDGWEVKIDSIKNCDKAPKELTVKIEPKVKGKIDYLMKKFVGTEWLAYLIGDEKENKVTDIFIPNQVVSSATVKNINCKEFNDLNIIGVIHSHHNMGNSFSSTDDEWINQNHNISLCISNSGIKGHVRWKTPCGGFKIIEARIMININSNFDKKEFDKIINEKIRKESNILNINRGYSNHQTYYPTNYKRVMVNNNNVMKNTKDKNNPGSYHFTDKPVLSTNDDDVIISKNALKIYDDVVDGLNCDMKEE